MSAFDPWLKDARAASQQTGVFVSTILAQWGIETGTFSSSAFIHGNNYAGVSYSGVSSFPTKAAGLSAYIQVLQNSLYDSVRAAVALGPFAQAKALGRTAWACSRYNENEWAALGGRNNSNFCPCDINDTPTPACSALLVNAGIDLVNYINSNNLTQYDGPGSPIAGTKGPTPADIFPNVPAGTPIKPPPFGTASRVADGSFFINGQTVDLALGDALVTAQLDFDIAKASTLTLTISDPDRVILQSGIFGQKDIVDFASPETAFELVSVEKQGSVITATFESWVVAALRTATGPFTVAPGTMTRTAFAGLLVEQVVGALFNPPPESWLYSQDSGYAANTKEIMSRGTADNPEEDSWTCLQRLASEVEFVCFEYLGSVYFGPEQFLVTQQPSMVPFEGVGGIEEINGTYDTGQPDGTITITCSAGSWFAELGDCIAILFLGPFNGFWLVSQITRDDLSEPNITITCVQPQPSLPEPATGGAKAAVGAGDVAPNAGSQQSPGGSTAAKAAVAYCVNQLGKPYVWGGENPATGFDCSGLMCAAYSVSGVSLPRTTTAMWNSNIAKVTPGIQNLLPGDLLLFEGGDPPPPGHVGMVVSTNAGTNVVTLIDAYGTGFGVRYDTFHYVQPGTKSDFAGVYYGAMRPAP
jgi:cell wall-associated NlpC family hydrolase